MSGTLAKHLVGIHFQTAKTSTAFPSAHISFNYLKRSPISRSKLRDKTLKYIRTKEIVIIPYFKKFTYIWVFQTFYVIITARVILEKRKLNLRVIK